MKTESESEDQGFYKPSIQISEPTVEVASEVICIDEEMEEANTIINEERPTDFKPRFLSTPIEYHSSPAALEAVNFSNSESMLPIEYKKEKSQPYTSFREKYNNEADYELVYSKIVNNEEFSTYVFSLEGTPDYNPADFSVPGKHSSSAIFDSRFQCGNLLYAFRKMNSTIEQYDLIMQNDTNTKGYNQWFYFSFKNRESKKVKLNIVNFIKKKLMFLDGVRPVGFSMKDHEKLGKGWDFMGENIVYRKSYVTREIQTNPPTYRNYYTLSFQLNLENPHDTIYLAYNYPYSYSRMIKHITNLSNEAQSGIIVEKNILCHTISNNAVPYLRIRHQQNTSKNVFLCMGRQHPGETAGSFVLEKFMNEIIKDKQLLKKYEFIIFPMVNPDGVVYGNFRTNLSGFDLNRQWLQPNRWLHPEIYFLSKFIAAQSNIIFCLDFHSHSKKLNSFIYACSGDNISSFRLYPYVFSKNSKYFSLEDCTYSITPDKIRTARVNIYNKISKPHVYTLQTSFFGHSKNGRNMRWNEEDFIDIARGAATGFNILFLKKNQTKKLEEEVKAKSFLFEQWALNNNEDFGSESNPEEDEFNAIERKTKVMSEAKALKPAKILKKKKKKKLKSPKKNKQSLRLFLKKKESDNFLEDKPASQQKKRQADSTVIVSRHKKQKPEKLRQEIKSSYLEPKITEKPPLPYGRSHQIRTLGIKRSEKKLEDKSQTNSNLLAKNNYIKYREQKSLNFKSQQKLEISPLKDPLKTIHDKSDYFHKSRRGIKPFSLKVSPQAQDPSQSKKKNKERVYVIKEHKVVNSITRINQEEIKKEIQSQISNRTDILRNCQKIMNNLSLTNKNQRPKLEEDIYKTKKILKPLDLQRHRNNKNIEPNYRGIFFSFI